jgi:hypothetical protein
MLYFFFYRGMSWVGVKRLIYVCWFVWLRGVEKCAGKNEEKEEQK